MWGLNRVLYRKVGEKVKGFKRLTRDKERELIRNDLLKQLKDRNMFQQYYVSLVNDYIHLWDVKNGLVDNIEENGVTITYNNGGGQSGEKKNDCVPELYRINGQMLKLLDNLGLRGSNIKIESEEFEL